MYKKMKKIIEFLIVLIFYFNAAFAVTTVQDVFQVN